MTPVHVKLVGEQRLCGFAEQLVRAGEIVGAKITECHPPKSGEQAG